MIRNFGLVLLMVLLPVALVSGAADGNWLKKVPGRDHEKISPYQGQPDAIAAGRRIFVDRCSQCHGEAYEEGDAFVGKVARSAALAGHHLCEISPRIGFGWLAFPPIPFRLVCVAPCPSRLDGEAEIPISRLCSRRSI